MDIMAYLNEKTPRIVSSDPLVLFLYLLMRDHLPTGTVVALVQTVLSAPASSCYTNGYLAQLAELFATELRGVK